MFVNSRPCRGLENERSTETEVGPTRLGEVPPAGLLSPSSLRLTPRKASDGKQAGNSPQQAHSRTAGWKTCRHGSVAPAAGD